MNPEFIIYTGPMMSSKTTKLLAEIERYHYKRQKVVAFKPAIDIRYDNEMIVSHAGAKFPAAIVSTASELDAKIVAAVEQCASIIALDEAFMVEGCADILIKNFRQGCTILVSSIELSATGQVFTEISKMMPWATKIEKCTAVCVQCGADARYTEKKFASLDEIVVGGADMYEPRCWTCHSIISQ